MKGKIIVICSLFITVILWIIDYSLNSNIYLTISRITALLGVMLISWEFILSSRSIVIEELFDGLDKVYKFHHSIGRWGFIMILIHPLMLIVSALARDLNPYLYILPIGPISYNVGIFSLYIFSILLIITLFLKIEYHLWKITHNLMGIPLLFMLIHVLLISSDISSNFPLRIYIVSFVILANIFFLYKRIFYHIYKGYEYVVIDIIEHGSSVEIILKSIKRKISFYSSQFVFIQAINSKLTKEMHPFTIAGKNNEGELSLIIKMLGDYTQEINELKKNDIVKIYGPHGRFYKHFNYENQVWIAGGIGITPFLAKLQDIYLNIGYIPKKITLYYIARTSEEFVYVNKLKEYQSMLNNFELILHDSSKLGRLDPTVIISKEKTGYLICASETLTENILNSLKSRKIENRYIHTELFKLY